MVLPVDATKQQPRAAHSSAVMLRRSGAQSTFLPPIKLHLRAACAWASGKPGGRMKRLFLPLPRPPPLNPITDRRMTDKRQLG